MKTPARKRRHPRREAADALRNTAALCADDLRTGPTQLLILDHFQPKGATLLAYNPECECVWCFYQKKTSEADR